MSETNDKNTPPTSTPPAENQDEDINKIIQAIEAESKEQADAIKERFNKQDAKIKEKDESIANLEKELTELKSNTNDKIGKELEDFKNRLLTMEKGYSTRMTQVPTGNPNNANQGNPNLKEGWLTDKDIPADKKLELFKKQYNI